MSVTISPAKPASAPSAVVFKDYEDVARKRLLMAVDALSGNGKTNFSLTAPGPVAVHNFDDGLEGVADKFQKDPAFPFYAPNKKLKVFHYQVPQSLALPGTPAGDTIAGQAKKVWEEFVINFRESLKQMGTVVVDTSSEAWELARLARLGKLAQVLPHQYVAVNAEFRELLRLAYRHDANLILLHKLKKEYQNDKPTGNYERSGFGDTDFIVQVVLRATKDPKAEGYDKFHLKINKCRQNPLLEETVLTGTECNFAKVASMVTNSSEEEWQ